MTDNEIIKALECCSNGEPCANCPYQKQCDETDLAEIALDLINRQQAEIERLQETQCTEKCHTETLELFNIKDTEIEKLKEKVMSNDKISIEYPHCVLLGKGAILTKSLEDYDKLLADIADGAITEFAERLKSKLSVYDEVYVDNLVKEMVGEGK